MPQHKRNWWVVEKKVDSKLHDIMTADLKTLICQVEDEEQARLMSSAPEMLSTLEDVLVTLKEKGCKTEQVEFIIARAKMPEEGQCQTK